MRIGSDGLRVKRWLERHLGAFEAIELTGEGKDLTVKQHGIVPPELYNREYYLADNEGFSEFKKGLDKNIHDKFRRVLDIVDIKPGMSVLDLGCGRGEMIYYCAKAGARAVGIDYSPDAVAICRQFIQSLASSLQNSLKVLVGSVEDFRCEEKFDYIFMVEVAEHMYDWQIERTLRAVHGLLKPGGRLIITTPNYLYERYFQPVKMTLDVPLRFMKYLLRIPRGKLKPKSLSEFLRAALKVKVDRGERHQKMHCNVTTRRRLKGLLCDFDARIYCSDPSINPLSLLVKRWLGRQIIAVAKIKKAEAAGSS